MGLGSQAFTIAGNLTIVFLGLFGAVVFLRWTGATWRQRDELRAWHILVSVALFTLAAVIDGGYYGLARLMKAGVFGVHLDLWAWTWFTPLMRLVIVISILSAIIGFWRSLRIPPDQLAQRIRKSALAVLGLWTFFTIVLF